MTLEDVRKRLDEIRVLAEVEDDVAHSREDELYKCVLAAIAAGAPNAPELAAEALLATEIEFARWCS